MITHPRFPSIGLLLALALISPQISAQPGAWHKISNPMGGPIVKLCRAGDKIFTITRTYSDQAGRIYRWESTQWIELLSADTLFILDIRGNKEFMFALTVGGKLFRSSDSGDSWSLIPDLPLLSTRNLWSVDSSSILIVDVHDNLWYSADNGDNWIQLQTPNGLVIGKIAHVQSGLLFVSAAQSLGSEIFRSVDTGRTWQKIFDDPYENIRTIVGVDSFVVLAGEAMVHRSANWGWTFQNSLSPGSDFIGIAETDSAIYMAMGGGHSESKVYHSKDFGASWDSVFEFGARCGPLVSINGSVITYVDNHIYCSTDHGYHWSNMTNGIAERGLLSFAGNLNGDVIAFGDGIMRSADHGNTWLPAEDSTTIPENPVTRALAIQNIIMANDTVFLFTDSLIYRSCDLGHHFNSFSALPARGHLYFSEHALFVKSNQLYRSMNYGLAWEQINVATSRLLEIGPIFPLDGDGLFVSVIHPYNSDSTGLYRSTDNGTTWSISGWRDRGVDKLVGIGNTLVAWSKRTVFESSDNADTWTARPGLDSSDCDVYWQVGTEVLATSSTYPKTTFISDDTLRSLRDFTSHLPSGISLENSYRVGSAIYASDYQHIWQIDSMDLLSVESGQYSVFPTQLVLYPNYPNPFNPSTNVSFTISRREFISLRVFDVLGREVKILFEGVHEAGRFTVPWNGSSASSGLYFLVLSDGKSISSHKMMLVK